MAHSSSLESLLLLALLEGIGPSRLAALIRHFGSAEQVLRAGAREIELLPGIGAPVAHRIAAVRERERGAARRAREALERLGALALTPDHPRYPDAFRVLPDPPYLLFAAGDLELLSGGGAAVVGTRTPSEYGRAATVRLSGGVAAAGYPVVSGMARGIDTLAHTAALDAGGTTVGVLGHGIEQVYPPENRRLFERVREHGLLITEFVPGETPKAGNFPRRNRLIAALSRVVLVVEMGLKSGAQHTVTYGLEQGKEVLAVPGPITSPGSEGTNQLIKDGARLVSCVEDVLEELAGVGARPLRAPAARSLERPTPPVLPLLSPQEDRVLAALQPEARHVDELSAATALVPGVLLGTLLELELKGLAHALPGKLYRRG